MLNIAEGSGKFTRKDRRNFIIISRASAFECASILQFLYEEKEVSKEFSDEVYNLLEFLSRKLY